MRAGQDVLIALLIDAMPLSISAAMARAPHQRDARGDCRIICRFIGCLSAATRRRRAADDKMQPATARPRRAMIHAAFSQHFRQR